MKLGEKTQAGFTIVELLIVIVVIAILAAITVVAYNGIQNRAQQSRAASSAKQAATKVQLYKAENGDYPESLVDAGVEVPNGLSLAYAKTNNWFCVAATASGSNVAAGSGSSGNCGGLKAEYFNNQTLSGTPVITRTDASIDYNWVFDAPGPGVNPDNFSARWTGFITAPVTGSYTLHFWYDNILRLYLNEVQVFSGATHSTWQTASYSFTAGQQVPFRLEMSESGGGAAARMHWSYPGQAQTPVPPTALSSP